MRAVLVQNMREKYAGFGEICAKICRVYAAYMCHYGNMWPKMTRARVFTLDKMRRNAEKCDCICGNRRNMRLCANFCIIYA